MKLDSRAGSKGLGSRLTILVRHKIRGMTRLMSMDEELGASIGHVTAGGRRLMASGGQLTAPGGGLRVPHKKLMKTVCRLMAPDARSMSSGRDSMSSCRRAMACVGELNTGSDALKAADDCGMTRDGRVKAGDGDSRASVVRFGPRGQGMKGSCCPISMADCRTKLGDSGMSVCGRQMKVPGRGGMKGAE